LIVLLGGVWGDHGELQLGWGLLNLRDKRKGREHEPHPLILRLSPLLTAMTRGAHPDSGTNKCFVVKQRRLRRVGGSRRTYADDTVAPSLAGSTACAIDCVCTDRFGADWSVPKSTFSYPTQVARDDVARFKRFRFSIGDTVRVKYCNYQGAPGFCFAKIAGFTKVTFKGNSHILVHPVWLDRDDGDELFLAGNPYVGGERHPLRRTLLVRLSEEDAKVSCFSVDDIDAQVLLHHHCCVQQSSGDRVPRDKVLLKVPSGVEDKEDQKQRRKRNTEAKAHNARLAARRFAKTALLGYCTCGASVC
jgi:hypothetical protein